MFVSLVQVACASEWQSVTDGVIPLVYTLELENFICSCDYFCSAVLVICETDLFSRSSEQI